MLESIEVHIIVSGRVQGVGFRWTTQHFAKKLGLKGTVRNVPNGAVEIIAQGKKSEIEQLVKNLSESFELNSNSFEISYRNPQSSFTDFVISG